MISTKNIRIEDFDYNLSEEKIAFYPLPERDASKLLVYKNGEISETIFKNIADEIPENALLVFNDTKVIHARIVTQTPTGHRLEIFCLEPIEPVDAQLMFQQKNRCVWKCFIGGNRKWKDGSLELSLGREEAKGERLWAKGASPIAEMSDNGEAPFALRPSPLAENQMLTIKRGKQIDDAWEIIFEWNNDLTFAEILDAVGKIPLPPYIDREAEESDEDRYQTIFAKEKGSVAAPTASLHFTEDVMRSLEKRNIETATLTLHVGAGTFKPVTSEKIGDHVMHDEKVIVSQDCLQKILKAKSENRPIIAVGTTSLRSLESLYWLKEGENHVEQWAPYETVSANGKRQTANGEENSTFRPSPFALRQTHQSLQFSTALMINPGYKFQVATGIITNFHQPKSTLLLLISAIVGDDWRKIYDYALSHDFRFLSYGDSSLLWLQEK
ncbi:MAG: S-adenosylmethionine:tRNA ribosyltransferase-isomerase [Bacteroidales bacterium]|nr:S-adenosylmethionine:tRNA ribosyltransferase-isomerase [Bacteroidales bacterium]